MTAKKTAPKKTAAPKADEKPETKPQGRPSSYTQKVADEIVERLAEGEPLRQICRDERMPSWRTVYDWKSADAGFSARIAGAREAGFDAIAEECLEIADDTSRDTLTDDNGDRANTEWISRSKLKIDTRLKLLSKWDPARYGDKLQQEHTGKGGGPLQIVLNPIDADL